MKVKDLGDMFKVYEGSTSWIISKKHWEIKTKKQALELVKKLEREKKEDEGGKK